MKLGTKHVIHKILLRKRIDMVAGMQVSYLAGKSVFYRPEHIMQRGDHNMLNFEDFEIQK